MGHNHERGSVLFLIPIITLISIALIGLLINTAYVYYIKQRLVNISLACALQGTNQLSQQNFYSSGVLTLNAAAAVEASRRCLGEQRVQGVAPELVTASVTGTVLTLDASLTTHLPLLGPLLGAQGPITFTASVAAKETTANGT